MKRTISIWVTIVLALATVNIALAADTTGSDLKGVKDVYPALTSGALASAALADLPPGVLLRSGTMSIAQKDIDTEIAKAPEEVRGQLKKNAFFLLESRAAKDLLLTEAETWGKENNRKPDEDNSVLLRAYFESLASRVAVTEEEVKAFYDQNSAILGDATYEHIKDQLKGYVLDQKRQEAIDLHVNNLGRRHSIEVDKTWTAGQYALSTDNPVDEARKSGKPTLADFGADGCAPCDMMTPILESLGRDYAGKVNVVFVHVRKEQVLAARYGVQSIPVQVFFNKDGNEVFRHTGFFAGDQIRAKLGEMGVK